MAVQIYVKEGKWKGKFTLSGIYVYKSSIASTSYGKISELVVFFQRVGFCSLDLFISGAVGSCPVLCFRHRRSKKIGSGILCALLL